MSLMIAYGIPLTILAWCLIAAFRSWPSQQLRRDETIGKDQHQAERRQALREAQQREWRNR